MRFRHIHIILFLSILLLSGLVITQESLAGADGCGTAKDLSKEASRLLQSGNYDDAEHKLRKAVKLCSDSDSLHYNLGIVLYYQKKYADAEKEISRLLENKPDNAKALNALAMVYVKSGRYDEAYNLAVRANTIEPANEEYFDTKRLAGIFKDPPKLSLDATVKYPAGISYIEGGDSAELIVTINNKGNGEAYIKNIAPIDPRVAGFTLLKSNEHEIIHIQPDSKSDVRFKIQTDERLMDGPVKIDIAALEKNDFKIEPITVSVNTRSIIDIPPRTSIKRPNAIAVVIGNKDYKEGSGIPPVDFAEQDARVVKDYLVKTLGFDEARIIFLLNAGINDLKMYFGDEKDYKKGLLYRMAKEGDDIFVYYSGHGGPDTETKKAYIVTSDTNISDITLGYPLETLYNNLSKLNEDKNPGSIIVAIDACFSGGYDGGMLIKEASPLLLIAPPMIKGDNAVVMASSMGNQISSWYRNKRHGLFTYYFLKAIKDRAKDVENGKELTIAGFEKELTLQVRESAWSMFARQQEPNIMGNKNIVLIKSPK